MKMTTIKIRLVIVGCILSIISFGQKTPAFNPQYKLADKPNGLGKTKTPDVKISAKGVSAYTVFLLVDMKLREDDKNRQALPDSLLIKKYHLIKRNGRVYANSFILGSDNFKTSDIEIFGFLTGSNSGKIYTGLVPVDQIEKISNYPTVRYLQIGEPVEPTMDSASAATRVNLVHSGNQLPQSYYGDSVVVGIIDNGFDYTHPIFYNNTGTNGYRIKRVWEQNATTGTSPAPFSYGRELSTQTAILNAQTDNPTASHGTHVAGIAAGSGASTTYMGVAPKSDIVLVSCAGGVDNSANVFDGIKYIINYANSVNKSCVINISLGNHVGPHDGTSIFDQSCDGIVGQGKILVGAAGNSGSDSLFIGKSYTQSDTLLRTFLKFSNATFESNGSGTVDIWGNQNENFKVAVYLYNTTTNQFEDWIPYYVPANYDSVYVYTLFGTNNVPVQVQIGSGIQYNNKPNVGMSIDNKGQPDANRKILLEIIGRNTSTKMWGGPTSSNFVTFSHNNYLPPVYSGVTNYTMTEIGGTGNSIISVGAYISKKSWTAFNGSAQSVNVTVGAISDFSSKGPTADGRTKPDITAPGQVIVSSVNRFDFINYPAISTSVVTGVTNGTNNWYFAAMQGTSQAAPMVTGIVALWLQAYPNLTPTQAKTIMKDNAWTDSYTGTIPTTGNNTWGWGKIDAHKGLKNLLTKIPAQPIITPSNIIALCEGQSTQLSAPTGFPTYQWSNAATTQNITVTTGGDYSVRVINSQGYISPWSIPKTVTVRPNPPTPTILVNANILTSSATSGNQWYLDGSIIPAAIQQNYTATQSGNYHVVVTNSNNCHSQSVVTNLTITAIIDPLIKEKLKIFPIPTDGAFTVKSDFNTPIYLQIIDIAGKQVLKVFKLNKGINPIDASKLSKGIYLLKFIIDKKEYTEKLVIN